MYIHVVYLYPPPYFKVFSSYSPGLHSNTTFIVGNPRHSFPPHSLLLFPGRRGGDGRGRRGKGREGGERRGGERRGEERRGGEGREGGATDNQLVTV